MAKANLNLSANKDEFIFLPGHPEADSKGFINIHNPNLLNEMTRFVLEAQKSFHENELRYKRKLRITKF